MQTLRRVERDRWDGMWESTIRIPRFEFAREGKCEKHVKEREVLEEEEKFEGGCVALKCASDVEERRCGKKSRNEMDKLIPPATPENQRPWPDSEDRKAFKKN